MIKYNKNRMFNCLFGLVHSKRLGMSLDVYLVPKEVCSLDFVYCEVGKTTKLSLDRKEYINSKKIKAELTKYFNNNPDINHITFSGSCASKCAKFHTATVSKDIN